MSDFWISATTDLVTACAYGALAMTVFNIVKRTKFRFRSILYWFAAFILCRALGHLVEIYMLWNSLPKLWFLIKGVVAAMSVAAAIWIYRIRHEIVLIAKIDEIAEGRRQELEALTTELEKRVDERTADLNTAWAELDEAKCRAEAASAAKTQFLANMSHEIRTPLAAISGFSELLMGPHLSETEKIRALSTIQRNSAHLANLVNEILDLSKIEVGALEVERLNFETREVLDYVLSVVSFRAIEKGIALKVLVDSDVPSIISTDPTRLRQILVNVVGNAVKFTKSGMVEVSVFSSLIQNSRDRMIHFQVRDTGEGISEANRNRLFKPFSQCDSSTSRRFGGSGLGLVLSRSLAQALGGSLLLIKSESGVGSVFEVTINGGAVDPSVPVTGIRERSQTPVTEESNLEALRILIVDDAPDNRDLICALLRPTGAMLECAEDGVQGISMAMASDFDLVLMDVQMPVLDGHAATRELRSKGFRKPIIALTAHAMKEDRIAALMAGFDDYLTKPIQRTALIRVLAHYSNRLDIDAPPALPN